MNKRRQYIVGNMEAVLPAHRTTKENSRRSKTLLYYLEKADHTRMQVCSKVFLATLQVTQKQFRDLNIFLYISTPTGFFSFLIHSCS